MSFIENAAHRQIHRKLLGWDSAVLRRMGEMHLCIMLKNGDKREEKVVQMLLCDYCVVPCGNGLLHSALIERLPSSLQIY